MTRGLVLSAVLLLAAVAPSAQAATVARDALLRHDGRAVGHVRDERRVDDDGLRTRTTLVLSLREGAARRQVRVETEYLESSAGEPQAFERASRAGDVRARWRGERDGAGWRLRVERGGVHEERRVTAPADLLFPQALARRFAAGREFEYSALAAGDDDFVRWRLRPTADATVWLRRRAGGDADVPVRVVDGRLLEPVIALGLRLEPEACPDDCRGRVDGSLSPLDGLLLPAPYRIPRDALRGQVRYVVAGPDGAAPELPTAPGQRVQAGRRGAIVTVCATCADPAATAPDDLPSHLAPSPWLQSDDPRVRAFARHAGGMRSRPPDRRMRDMVAAVRAHMTGPIDYVGYATAVDALDSRRGDCTETAVLLAAAARAEGIPARVVVGIAYSSRFVGRSDVFGPHMWVQAWTGERWENFDAGLGEFGAGHIALGVGDGSPSAWQGLAARMRGLRIVDAAGIDASDAGGAAGR